MYRFIHVCVVRHHTMVVCVVRHHPITVISILYVSLDIILKFIYVSLDIILYDIVSLDITPLDLCMY